MCEDVNQLDGSLADGAGLPSARVENLVSWTIVGDARYRSPRTRSCGRNGLNTEVERCKLRTCVNGIRPATGALTVGSVLAHFSQSETN